MKNQITFPKRILILLCFFSALSYGQQAVIPGGGNAAGSLGNSSFTIGQIAYASNGNANYSVAEGVQQPYEISTLAVDEHIQSNIQLTAYPNPTLDYLTLDIDTLEIEALQYSLIDINGKLLSEEKITNQFTTINFTSLPGSTYFIKVTTEGKNIKTFKIIKN